MPSCLWLYERPTTAFDIANHHDQVAVSPVGVSPSAFGDLDSCLAWAAREARRLGVIHRVSTPGGQEIATRSAISGLAPLPDLLLHVDSTDQRWCWRCRLHHDAMTHRASVSVIARPFDRASPWMTVDPEEIMRALATRTLVGLWLDAWVSPVVVPLGRHSTMAPSPLVRCTIASRRRRPFTMAPPL